MRKLAHAKTKQPNTVDNESSAPESGVTKIATALGEEESVSTLMLHALGGRGEDPIVSLLLSMRDDLATARWAVLAAVPAATLARLERRFDVVIRMYHLERERSQS